MLSVTQRIQKQLAISQVSAVTRSCNLSCLNVTVCHLSLFGYLVIFRFYLGSLFYLDSLSYLPAAYCLHLGL